MPTKKQKQAREKVSKVRIRTDVKPHNVFISWSGARSKHIATALTAWLPTVLQQAKPWLSRNIEKGTRPLEEITCALETIEVGISCLTPENLSAPWILFEGGALSKRLGDQSRLCTYLLAGLEPKEVVLPLGMFQHTRALKDETKEMLVSLNKVIGDEPVADSVLDTTFEKMWPDLEESIEKMPAADSHVPDKRTEKDMIAEILAWTRQMGLRDKSREEERRTAENYRLLFGKDVANTLAWVPHHGFRPVNPINDEEWTKSGVINCPVCGTASVKVVRGGLKECERCGARNW
jgi:hypothetical protein